MCVCSREAGGGGLGLGGRGERCGELGPEVGGAGRYGRVGLGNGHAWGGEVGTHRAER